MVVVVVVVVVGLVGQQLGEFRNNYYESIICSFLTKISIGLPRFIPTFHIFIIRMIIIVIVNVIIVQVITWIVLSCNNSGSSTDKDTI